MLNNLLIGAAVKTLKGVHELDMVGGLTPAQLVQLRESVDILIVDDEDAEVLADGLEKHYGFLKVKPIKKRPDDALIKKYPIIVTDVRGIDDEGKSNGLKFAKSIKNQYPLKQVVVISGQLRRAEYRDDLLVLRDVDGVFDKNASTNDVLADLLNRCISNLYDPALVWRNVRAELLRRDGVKSDKSISEVALLEHQFVSSYLKRNKKQGIDKLEWLELMIKGAELATQVVKLLSTVKDFTEVAAGVVG